MKGRSGTVALLLVLGVLVLIPSAWAGAANNGGLPSIQVLSNQANLVSGGDALVQVVLPARVDPSTVSVSVDGRDVTSASPSARTDATSASSPVSPTAPNDVMATMRKGPTVHLTVTSHPIGGPVFAGPQVQPWLCKTVSRLSGAEGRAVRRAGRASRSPTWTRRRTRSSRMTRQARRAGADRHDDDRPGRDRAVHRPLRARRDGPRALRRRVLANPAAAGRRGRRSRLEPQAALPVRRRHRAVAHERRPAERRRSTSRSRAGSWSRTTNLNIRGDDGNDVVSAEAVMMLKEHIAETYGCDPLHDRRRLLRRLDPAVRDRGRLSGAPRRHPAELQLPGQLDDGERGERLPPPAPLLHHRPAGSRAAQQAAVEDTKDTSACLFWDLSFAPVGIPSRVVNCNLQGTPLASLVYDPVSTRAGCAATPGLPVRDLGLAAAGRLRPQPVRERRRAVRPRRADERARSRRSSSLR